MKVMYKPSEYEIKLIILFVIKNLRTSATYTILDYVISSSIDMNYFDLQQYIDNLIETDNITELTIDGERVFSLSRAGEETIGFFADRIPFSIRERLIEYVNITNKKKNVSSEITYDYYPISQTEYGVKMNIKENGVTMMKLDIYVGDKQSAKNICKRFADNTTEIYAGILAIINGEEPPKKDKEKQKD